MLWAPRSIMRLGKPTKTRKKTRITGGTVKDRMPRDHSLWVEEVKQREGKAPSGATPAE